MIQVITLAVMRHQLKRKKMTKPKSQLVALQVSINHSLDVT
jgi:hypothetical protein